MNCCTQIMSHQGHICHPLLSPFSLFLEVCNHSEKKTRVLLSSAGLVKNFPRLVLITTMEKLQRFHIMLLFKCNHQASSLVREIAKRYISIRAHYEAKNKAGMGSSSGLDPPGQRCSSWATRPSGFPIQRHG